MAQPLDLSRRERQIMEVLFISGPATVAEVRERMDDAPSDNAVRTFLTILEDKGYTQRKKQGRAYCWSPVPRREQAGKEDLKRVVRTFFGGSLAQAFTAYLADQQADLSEQDLDRLREAIEQTRSKGD